MAKKSQMVVDPRRIKFKVRLKSRCRKCGRARGFLRKFQMCRICFRNEALAGHIAGVTKASW